MNYNKPIVNELHIKKESPFNRTQRILIYIYFGLAFIERYLLGLFGQVSRYYIIFLIVALSFPNRKFKFKTYHKWYILWFIYKFITLLWTRDYSIFKVHVFSHIGMGMLFLYFTLIDFDKKTINGILKTTWILSGLIGVLSLFFNRPYYGGNTERTVLFLFGQEIDPNYQSALLLIGISISLYYLINKNHWIYSFIFLTINLYSIMMSGSRGGLIGFFIILVVTIIIYFKKINFRKLIYFLFIGIIAFFTIKQIIYNYLPGTIYSRLFDLSTYEGGSGRIFIWENAFELFSKGVYPLIGAGWGSFYGYNDIYSVVHNTFLSMLVEVGLLGFLLFFVPIIKASHKNFKYGEYLSIMILVSAFVSCLFLDAINARFFWNSIMILFIIYNFASSKQKILNNKSKVFVTSDLINLEL